MNDPSNRRGRYLVGVLLGGCIVVSLAACSASPSHSSDISGAPALDSLAQPGITVSGWDNKPVRDQAVGVMPGAPLRVTAHQGNLKNVSVSGADGAVKGTVSPDGATWTANQPLDFGAKYTLTAAANGVEGPGASRIGFTTASAESLASASSVTAPNETVGIGQPVMINFDQPVTNKRNAERAISITTDPKVEGAFHWVNDSMLRWRPEHFWKPGTKVKVSVRTKGIDLGDGVFGDNNLDFGFTIGRSLIATVDDNTKTVSVAVNGKVARVMQTSLGKNSTPTNNGIYIVAEREQSVIMDSSTYGVPVHSSEGYRETVYNATRLSYSGIYLHAAPWSVGDQGVDDVSNGCLNVNNSDAKWFLDNTLRGDVVIAKNTVGPELPGDDGLGDWNIPWSQWTKPSE